MENIVVETAVEIKNVNGLHMRPAMQFVDIANQFTCDINVSDGAKVIDGKSIMQIALRVLMPRKRLALCRSLSRVSILLIQTQAIEQNNIIWRYRAF